MKENQDVLNFSLTADDMNVINGLNEDRRYNDPEVFCEPGMGIIVQFMNKDLCD